MEYKKLSVFNALTYGVKTVLDDFKIFFLAYMIIISILLVTCLVAIGIHVPLFQQLHTALAGSMVDFKLSIPGIVLVMRNYAGSLSLMVLLFWFIASMLAAGSLTLVLEYYDTGTAHLRSLFAPFLLTLKLMGLTLVLMLMLIPAFCLLIIPGLYLLIRFVFSGFFLIDKNSGILESLKQSWSCTRGNVWPVGTMIIIQFLLNNLFGGWGLFLGITSFIGSMSYAYIYRTLVPR